MASNDSIICLDEEENEDSSIPDVQKCQELVDSFVELTKTNEALAQFFLQDHKWELEASIHAYYDSVSQNPNALNAAPQLNDSDVVVTFESLASNSPYDGDISVLPPDHFSLVSWNLDGIDERNLKKRTKAVVKVIETERPDIVFLQEVIPVTFDYLEKGLPEYTFVSGGVSDYFTATLIRRTTVYFDAHALHPFPNSRMGRNIIYCDCHIGSVELRLMNTHLESTKEFREERCQQLKSALDLVREGGSGKVTIFGGDLNLRDSEASQADIPGDVHDLWEVCGRREECKYTWDMLRNSNKSFPGRFQPRLRFDRLYLRNSEPKCVEPVRFGLVGIQKVSGTQSFPSDHWGVSARFRILNQTATTSVPPPSHKIE